MLAETSSPSVNALNIYREKLGEGAEQEGDEPRQAPETHCRRQQPQVAT